MLSASAGAGAEGLVNLSARALVTPGGEALTAGFVVAGTGSKRVLVRAAGPALGGFGVAGALAQVRLEVFRGSTRMETNTGWDAAGNGAALQAEFRATGAFDFAAGSRDAALVLDLGPGNYSAQVSAPDGGTGGGIALVEVFDAAPETSTRLVNLSARGRAGAGAETFIAGFVVAGTSRNRLLVRAAGPALAAFGLGGALADPRLEIFRDSVSLGYNDDWQVNADAARLAAVARGAGAFGFADGSRDAALLLPAANGAFTAHCAGAGSAAGVALLEVYDTSAQAMIVSPRTFDLVGFARVPGHGLSALTGGGGPAGDYNPSTRTGNFWRIDDATIAAAGAAFAAQLQAALAADTPLVVELNTMIDLSRFGRPNAGATAIAHPDLFAAGRTSGTVGTLAIGSNKTIYSAFGNGGFRRGSLSLSGKNNVMLRNLRFRELWEWDDATAGEYDRNDWDYLTVTSATSGNNVTARAHHIWIDHCDFEKSYDGLFDFVHGADLITVSWCKIAGAVSGETVRWVQRQLDHLEANRASFPYYHAQRASAAGAEILRREIFQKKSNLVGNGTDAATAAHDAGHLNVTFHHNWYVAIDQRMPRLRFGNAHVFNLLADSSAGVGVSGLSLMGVAATSNAAVRLENSRFVDVRAPLTISAGSEPVGRIAVINSVNLDSAARSDRGFEAARQVPVGRFAWNPPAAATGLAGWPQSDSAVMPAGYVPPGRALVEYLDGSDYLPANLAEVGVLVPADETEAGRLRTFWQATTAPR